MVTVELLTLMLGKRIEVSAEHLFLANVSKHHASVGTDAFKLLVHSTGELFE